MKKLELVMIIAAAAGAVAVGSYPEAAAILLLYLACVWMRDRVLAGSRARIEESSLLQAENGWRYEDAVSDPPRVERIVLRLQKAGTPAIAAIAVAAAVILSVMTGDWKYWVRVGCTFLIIGHISTLTASVSLAFRCGIAVSSARRILFKNGGAMETISNMKLVATGKQGILTDGQYGLQRVVPAIAFEEEEEDPSGEHTKETEEELILRLCAGAAAGAQHPAANGIARAAEAWKVQPDKPEEILESTEDGVCARLPEGIVCFGSREYLLKKGIRLPEPVPVYGLQIPVALDKEHIGTLILADRMKDGAERLIQAARHVGAKTAILTEESEFNASAVARHLNIDLVRADLTPEGRTEAMKDLRRKGGVTLYLGDGVRDAAAVAAADVSGVLGNCSAEAQEAADILYRGTELKPMEDSIDLAFVTTRIASENVVLAILVKLGIIFLGFVGYANLWLTVVAEIGVSVICIINAVRLLYFGKYRLQKKRPA